MNRILITAIGSFSASYAISALKSLGCFVLGTDIYPEEWHNITQKCDEFRQVSFATSDKYIPELLELCQEFQIDSILPLTDLEIDKLNLHRNLFESKGYKLLMPDNDILSIVRNKLALSKLFAQSKEVSIPNFIESENLMKWGTIAEKNLVAKPINGRSSEGLLYIKSGEDIRSLYNIKGYIIQEKLDGNIITVDYVRDSKGEDVSIPRIELLRTKNGAGTTVQLFKEPSLSSIVSKIGETLNIVGCVNLEFINNNDKYYLIDINPRFSAGVAFSSFTGYDMVSNHIKCHSNLSIDKIGDYKPMIIEKIYSEVCNKILKNGKE